MCESVRVSVPLVRFTLSCEVICPLRSDNTKRMFPGPSLLNDATGMGMENGNETYTQNMDTRHTLHDPAATLHTTGGIFKFLVSF